MIHRLSHGLFALALAAPLSLAAQQLAITAKAVNLRAGPDRFYPVVAVLPPNAQVAVQGCIPDYRWCDVSFGYERGWLYAGNLRYAHQQGYVPLVGIAPVIGITILSFGIHDYWGTHYRDRSWYGDRQRWDPPPRPRARPPAPSYQPPPARPPAPRVRPAPLPRPQVPPQRPGQPRQIVPAR